RISASPGTDELKNSPRKRPHPPKILSAPPGGQNSITVGTIDETSARTVCRRRKEDMRLHTCSLDLLAKLTHPAMAETWISTLVRERYRYESICVVVARSSYQECIGYAAIILDQYSLITCAHPGLAAHII